VVTLKSRREIAILRRANRAVAAALQALREAVEPGITTLELDRIAEDVLARHGAKPAFKGYLGFPNALCVSINEEIVHGIPSKRRLRRGDIVSMDIGARLEGYIGDAAITVPVGEVSPEAERLMAVTREALDVGIAQCVAGNRVSDLSCAIQRFVESHGFNVVRELVGHGVGRKLHEPPQIPNYCDPQMRTRLREGMVLALEPMVVEGDWRIKTKADGWTAVTYDGKLAAHFEHSVVITRNGPQILSILAD